eukprot:TRINITY_DN132_c0_g1_i1.p1 TRINITY_DN132_c0_g1~~TRINITY_DN132_c0_g1_i1.p1  ORF type:complete len:346 (+),score=59.59 TRINITY_DN132_c0_g1_i1:83-1120(+)
MATQDDAALEKESRTLCSVRIREQLQQCVVGCELRIGLFWAASTTYRKSSVCEPFPPFFFKTSLSAADVSSTSSRTNRLVVGEKDFDVVDACWKTFPSMSELTPKDEQPITFSPFIPAKTLKLLDWIVGLQRKVQLVECTENAKSVLPEGLRLRFKQPPNLLFKVNYPNTDNDEFETLARKFGTKWGFHGSAVENWHSILMNGFSNGFTKNAIFGDGVYFSEDPDVAFNFVKFGRFWKGQSKIGDMIGGMALCEVVNLPGAVETHQESDRSSSEIPRYYIVVKDERCIKMRYLFVYNSGPAKGAASSILRNYLFLFVIIYILFLLVLRFSNSAFARRYIINALFK